MDGDDYHSSESVGKMSRGQPLTDLVHVLLLVMSGLLALQSFGRRGCHGYSLYMECCMSGLGLRTARRRRGGGRRKGGGCVVCLPAPL